MGEKFNLNTLDNVILPDLEDEEITVEESSVKNNVIDFPSKNKKFNLNDIKSPLNTKQSVISSTDNKKFNLNNLSESIELDEQIYKPAPLGRNNELLIDLPLYFNDMARSRGPKSEVAGHYYEATLTQEDILNDPVMMEVVRSSLAARYDPSLISKLAGITTGAMGAATGGMSRDYWKMSDEKVFDTYEEWMRGLESINGMTVVNEFNAGLFASDEQRAQMGEGYRLHSKRDNSVIGRGSWSEMADALGDYGEAFVWDATNLVTLGIGKLLFGMGVKSATPSVGKLLQGTYKSLRKNKNLSREAAEKAIAKMLGRREAVLAAAAFTLPDLAQNIGLEFLYQSNLINLGKQEEINRNSLAIVGFTSMLIPALSVANVTLKELRRSDFLKDTFLAYSDVDKKIKLTSKKAEEILNEKVQSYMPQIIDTLDENFGNIKGDTAKLKQWKEAKEIARKELEAQGKNVIDNDTVHTARFFREFFFDTVDKEGNIITKGYLNTLKDAGFIFHQQMIDESKVSGVLGQTIEYLSDDTVQKIIKAFEDRTGKSLNLDGTAKTMSNRFINNVVAAGQLLQVSSRAVQSINNITKDMPITLKTIMAEDTIEDSPKRFQWMLSIYKRLLTSHPATTGSNLKGFQALTLLDTASEIATSAINVSQSGFYKTIGGDKDKGVYYANQAYGNFLGAIRRGASVLTPDLEIGYANTVLSKFPKVKSRLFRDISGDGGAFDSLELFNLEGKKSKILGGRLARLSGYKVVDTVTKGAQTVSLVRLQDELTKLWAFGNNVNANIMKTYRVTPEKFFARDDIGIEILTPRFQKEVLDKATFKTMRQTMSVNWSTLKSKHGNSIFREGAKFIEKATNKTAGGFLVPFGSFMNTVLANFGDFSGINAVRFMVANAQGKKLDPETQNATDAISKMAVAYTYVFYRTFYGPNSGINKVNEGRLYNENITSTGDVANIEYDYPLDQFDLTAQILAHGLSGTT